MLFWASKFATAKIEFSFEMGKYTPLGVTFILLAVVQQKYIIAVCNGMPFVCRCEESGRRVGFQQHRLALAVPKAGR